MSVLGVKQDPANTGRWILNRGDFGVESVDPNNRDDLVRAAGALGYGSNPADIEQALGAAGAYYVEPERPAERDPSAKLVALTQCDPTALERWLPLTLEEGQDWEAVAVAAGKNLLGQVLDLALLPADERAELLALLETGVKHLDREQRNREAELLAKVPRRFAPGLDIDHAIARYVVRCDGVDLLTVEVQPDEAREFALGLARRLEQAEAQSGVTLRLAWSGGPDRGGIHCDYGPATVDAATPVLLWALKGRVRAVCESAGIATSDDVNEDRRHALADELRDRWPLRERRVKVPAGERREAIARYSDQKMLVIELSEPVDPDAARALVDEVRAHVPPCWVDLVPLNHRPGSRGRLFRPLGGKHKTWSPENPGAIKTLIDPDAAPPSPITGAMLEPYLAAAEARAAEELAPKPSRQIVESTGPAGPAEVRRNRRKSARRSWGDSLAALPEPMQALVHDFAEEWGPTYAADHDAGLGITGVMRRRGIDVGVICDVVYYLALAADESKAGRRAEEAERMAQGDCLAGWHRVREDLGDEFAEALAYLVDALAPDTAPTGALAQARWQVARVQQEVEDEDDPHRAFAPAFLDAISVLEQREPEAYANARTWVAGKIKPVTGLTMSEWDRQRRQRAKTAPVVTESAGGKRPDPYAERDGCLYLVRRDEDGTREVPMTTWSARIVSQVRLDEGVGDPATRFRIEGRAVNGPARTFEVPAAEFAAMTWPVTHLGAQAVTFPTPGPNHARCAVQMLSGDVPGSTVYAHTGWRRINGEWVYLHAGGAIGAAGVVEGIDVDLGTELADYSLPEPPTGPELADAVRASLRLLDVAPPRVSVPLLGVIYRAALGETKFGGAFLVAKTGSFKSCLSAIAQQYWGASWDFQTFPGNWESTANALEGLAFKLKDAVFTVDDFVPNGTSYDADKLHKAADRLLRGAANGRGRQRMASDTEMRATRWPRGLVVSSGEELPKGQSLRARILVLRVNPGDVDVKVLTELQQLGGSGAFARAMSAYVSWLAPQMGSINPRAEVAALRGEFQSAAAHAQTPGVMANVYVGLRYFARFAEAAGVLRNVDAWLGEQRRVLLSVMGDQAAINVESDQVELFRESLAAALASGQAHLALPGGLTPLPVAARSLGWRHMDAGWEHAEETVLKESPRGGTYTSYQLAYHEDGSPVFKPKQAGQYRPQGPQVGWIDQDTGDLWLLPGKALEAARCPELRITEQELGIQLRDRGDLVRTNKKARTTKVRAPSRLNANRAPVWHLRAEWLTGAAETEETASNPTKGVA